MNRLIDADELREKVKILSTLGTDAVIKACCQCVIDLIDMAANYESPDVVPVVRCGDCIHYHEGTCLKIYDDGDMSKYAIQNRKPDDFCSYGERKKDDQ